MACQDSRLKTEIVKSIRKSQQVKGGGLEAPGLQPASCGTITGMDSDSRTTIQTLKRLLREFRDERDWQKFHDPKNLAEAISVEASELLLFLWKNAADVKKSMKSDREFRKSVKEELADVLCFSLRLANAAKIDVARAVKETIQTNRLKYPVEKSKGRATKYSRL
jgi:NTP pyrophosphatase (non-canonical NTP hydrolase)